jgi:hypothetical protein
MGIPRFIGHDPDVLAPDAITTVIFFKNDLFLQEHDQLSRLCMSLIELLRVMEFVYILPSATGEGFHKGRESRIIKYALPVEGISEVAKGLIPGIRG